MTGATQIAHITTKQDMSRWTRAHADAAGITWSVVAGPGGTMIIVEHRPGPLLPRPAFPRRGDCPRVS